MGCVCVNGAIVSIGGCPRARRCWFTVFQPRHTNQLTFFSIFYFLFSKTNQITPFPIFFSLIYCKNVLSCRQSTWSFLEIFLYGKKFLLTFIDIGGDDDDEDEYNEEID